jgi:hypothetical protein
MSTQTLPLIRPQLWNVSLTVAGWPESLKGQKWSMFAKGKVTPCTHTVSCKMPKACKIYSAYQK